MSMLARKQEERLADLPVVALHRDLIRVSQRQIASSPRVETGGKFLGFIITPGSEPPKTPYGRDVARGWRKLAEDGGALLLVASISPGPRARCTPTELLPDGEFQDGVFRMLEAQEPDLQHLGTWHSHHPNGLSHFSSGDVAHYWSVIKDKNHEPDYFVAGLCVDGRGLGRTCGGLEIFGRRGGGLRATIGEDKFRLMGQSPSLQAAVEDAEREVARRLASAPAPLEGALGKFFRVHRAHEDGESLTWAISDRSGQDFQGVVTQVKGEDGYVAVQIEISGQGSSLSFSGPVSGGDARELVSRLLRVTHDLDSASRAAGKRGWPRP